MNMVLADMRVDEQRSAIADLPDARQCPRAGEYLIADALHIQDQMIIREAIDFAGEFADHDSSFKLQVASYKRFFS